MRGSEKENCITPVCTFFVILQLFLKESKTYRPPHDCVRAADNAEIDSCADSCERLREVA